jgi:hypothetical protein
MKWVCRMKKSRQMSNHIDTLVIKKYFKEENNINIDIIDKEDGIIINIHGIWNHKTIIQQDISIDQHLLQIGEASITIHGIKGKKIMKQITTKDYD